MAVITIAVCDEVRKDAQKLVKKLSELIPEAEILVYRNRESLLNGLKDEHKRCDVLFMGLDGEKGENLETVRAIRLGGNYVPVGWWRPMITFIKKLLKCLHLTISPNP